MAATDELKAVLREKLESRGVLGQLRAQIRAEVYKALDDQKREKPQLSNENLMINELIKEYLKFNGYNYTCSVFLTETGQPKEGLSTEFLAQELSLQSSEQTPVPLLYQMLAHFKTTPASSSSKPHPLNNASLEPAPTSPHHGNHSYTTTNDDTDPPAVIIEGQTNP